MLYFIDVFMMQICNTRDYSNKINVNYKNLLAYLIKSQCLILILTQYEGVLNMNKLKKIGLTALAGSLVAGAVNAADMSVTGSAGITLSGGDNRATTGNGFTMGDSLTFSASGDVNDIGITLSLSLIHI